MVLLALVAAGAESSPPGNRPAPEAVGATVRPKPPPIPSTHRRLHLIKTITGHITPKSVVSDRDGLIFAQNMVYTHTVTVYDSHTMGVVKTISDRVRPSRFGLSGYPGTYQGLPGRSRRLTRQAVHVCLELPDVRREVHQPRVRRVPRHEL